MDMTKQFLLAMAITGTSISYAANLEVQLNLVDPLATNNDDLNIELTITNQEAQAVQLLKWYLAPNDKLQSNAFSISVDGSPVQYTGPIVKRPTPSDADYITLEAGQSITQKLALSSFYNMIESGTYQATYNVTAMHLIKSSIKAKSATQAPQTLSSNKVSTWLKGIDKKSLTQGSSNAPRAKTGGSISYLGSCSNRQKTAINNGVSAAQDIANTAYDYLLDNNYTGDQSTRYNTWFGAYTNSRYANVTDHFSKISDALSNQNVQLDCGCMDDLKSAYAYVYQNDPYHIYVCDSFWQAPTSGTDSKAGTLVHEMSHFYVNGGTDDHVYGQYSAKQLAKSDPDKAVMNADSHEYFAENTPYLD